MAKLKMNWKTQRKKKVPLVMALFNRIIKELNLVEIINKSVKWSSEHWNLSPGTLAKFLLLGTCFDIRTPLMRYDDRFEGIDIEYFSENGDKGGSVNSYNIGEALERIGEADSAAMYEKIVLNAFRQYEIPINRMNSDTTTISFYGEYNEGDMDLNAEERDELLKIEKGYNKDGRPDSKQLVVGQITNEHGFPMHMEAMDGGTSDIEWNRNAIEFVTHIREKGFKTGIYVADCKLVVDEHITKMNDPENPIPFVSRCPASFSDKLESRMIKRAREEGEWQVAVNISEAKNASEYKIKSFTETLCGAPMRLVVVNSSTLAQAAEKAYEKSYGDALKQAETIEKGHYMCYADAEKAFNESRPEKVLAPINYEASIEKQAIEKWPAGRRGKNTKPIIKETYHIKINNISKSEPYYAEFMHKESCFVLISNVDESVSDIEIVKTYKGQYVVENSFRQLKSPPISVRYLLEESGAHRGADDAAAFGVVNSRIGAIPPPRRVSEARRTKPRGGHKRRLGGQAAREPDIQAVL